MLYHCNKGSHGPVGFALQAERPNMIACFCWLTTSLTCSGCVHMIPTIEVKACLLLLCELHVSALSMLWRFCTRLVTTWEHNLTGKTSPRPPYSPALPCSLLIFFSLIVQNICFIWCVSWNFSTHFKYDISFLRFRTSATLLTRYNELLQQYPEDIENEIQIGSGNEHHTIKECLAS